MPNRFLLLPIAILCGLFILSTFEILESLKDDYQSSATQLQECIDNLVILQDLFVDPFERVK